VLAGLAAHHIFHISGIKVNVKPMPVVNKKQTNIESHGYVLYHLSCKLDPIEVFSYR
jgi:hypothetical protein